MIWEPFILALGLGIIVSAGLYFAYLWEAPSPEADDGEHALASDPSAPAPPSPAP